MAPSLTLTTLLLHVTTANAGLIHPWTALSKPIDDTIAPRDIRPSHPSPRSPSPVILKPLRATRRSNTKRSRRTALSLQSSSTFQWLGADGTLATMDVQTPSSNENIVNLELIDDMVSNITCPSTTAGDLRITFTEAADFDDAEDIWAWVDRDPANHFLMVLAGGTCGREERVIYDVSGLGYVDASETAVLKVKEVSWKEAAHTFDLTLGKVTSATKRRGLFDGVKDWVEDVGDKVKETVDKGVDAVKEAGNTVVDAVKELPGKVVDAVDDLPGQVKELVEAVPVKAEEAVDDLLNPSINPDFSIPFDNRLSDKPLSFSAEGLSLTANCKECFTTGSFDISGKFRAQAFQMQEAWIELATEGVSAKAVIGLGFKGNLTEKLFERSLEVFKFSPAGVAIPGVLTVGPVISVSLGVEVSEVAAGVNIALGGTATIPKSSSRLDFLSKANTKTVGWKPEFKAEPFKSDGMVEVKATAFLRPAIGLEISVVDTGLTAEISANTPSLTASLKALAATECTVCGGHQSGIQGDLTIGASVGASLKTKVLGIENSLFSVNFVDKRIPIAGFCEGFGPQGDACLAAKRR
ncbi:hypothetical protein OQA88_10260 [Cercophora sp. LCS_1]